MNWSFVLKPRWILGHLIIVICCAIFISCAAWQLDRLHQRQDRNAQVKAKMELLPMSVSSKAVEDLAQWEKVAIDGRWDTSHLALVRYPIRDGVSGYYLLMPFVTEKQTVMVNLGFIPREKGDALKIGNSTEGGFPEKIQEIQEIEGLVRDSQSSSKEIGMTTNGVITVGAVDLPKLRDLMETEAFSNKWVQLTSPSFPEILPLTDPDLSEGPHRGYVYQWISFTLLAIIGWGALLVREAKETKGKGEA